MRPSLRFQPLPSPLKGLFGLLGALCFFTLPTVASAEMTLSETTLAELRVETGEPSTSLPNRPGVGSFPDPHIEEAMSSIPESAPQRAEHLWQLWLDERFVKTPAPCLLPETVEELHGQLETDFQQDFQGGRIQIDLIGNSFEGRPIRKIRLGKGSDRLLLWSQMHGDEPSATPALFDLAAFLLTHSEEASVKALLERYELHLIPMLNPDGAERYQRRNAQGLDINRDALHLSSPEGRLLKKIRDSLNPLLGFNLHDKSRRTIVRETGELATLSVLAVSGDEENTLTPGRARAMRACSAVVKNTNDFVNGRIARYNEDWNPRAFGDNITAWGTPVVLIESGGVPPGTARDGLTPFEELTRLNFLALVSVLFDLAEDDLEGYSPKTYQDLSRTNSDGYSDIVFAKTQILQPGSSELYRSDLALNVRTPERSANCTSSKRRPSASTRTVLTDVGDARFEATGQRLNAEKMVVTRPLRVGLRLPTPRQNGKLEAVLKDLVTLGVREVIFEEEVPSEVGPANEAVVAGNSSLKFRTLTTRNAPQLWLELHELSERIKAGRKFLRPLRLHQALEILTGESSAMTLRQLQIPDDVFPGRTADFLILEAQPETDVLNLRLQKLFLDGQWISLDR